MITKWNQMEKLNNVSEEKNQRNNGFTVLSEQM
jgi:hypothetical protein